MENYHHISDIGFHFALETVEGTALRRRLTADAINRDSSWHA